MEFTSNLNKLSVTLHFLHRSWNEILFYKLYIQGCIPTCQKISDIAISSFPD